MSQDLRIRGNKRARGEIVALLSATYPRPIEVRTMGGILRDSNYITGNDITPLVDYLIGKGYIALTDDSHAASIGKGIIPINAYMRLTALGVNLVEGDVDDPGVDI